MRTLIAMGLLATLLVMVPAAMAVQVEKSGSGHITDVYWATGSVPSCGYDDEVRVTVQNTGSEAHEFWVLVEVQDPTGEWHDGDWFEHTATIVPNKEAVSSIRVLVDPCESKMPKGYYNGRVTLYEDFFKHNQLDSQTKYQAFKAV